MAFFVIDSDDEEALMHFGNDPFDELGFDDFDPDFNEFDLYSDDLDYFDDDEFDTDDEEADRDHNKIFVSLHDSHVMKKMCFHKTVGRCRLPQIQLDKDESLESLYHVFDELELLLKTWKKRTQHSFTAHIERKEQCESCAQNEIAEMLQRELRFGIDYSDHDMEHESDDEFVYCGKEYSDINETLTKKKYCQSTKIFYAIFPTEKDYENFFILIKNMKKFVFNSIFHLFNDIVPPGVIQKLPPELWEKIWKLTQVNYDEKTALHVGTKAKDELGKALELERIKDLFGAAGNLHMMIFEILFKHAYITAQAPILELQRLNVLDKENKKKFSYVSFLFDKYKKILEANFCRFKDLCHYQELPEDLCDEGKEEETGMLKKISRGQTFLSANSIDLKKEAKLFFHEERIFVTPSTFCDVVGFVTGTGDSEQSKAVVLIWNVIKNQEVVTIETDQTFVDLVAHYHHYRFALTSNHFALLCRDVDLKGVNLKIIHWKFDRNAAAAEKITTPTGVIVERLHHVKGDLTSFRHDKTMIKAEESDRGYRILLCSQSPFEEVTEAKVIVYEANQDVPERNEITFQDSRLEVCWFKGNRCMLISQSTSTFYFMDVTSGTVLCRYPFSDLCKDANHVHDANDTVSNMCRYECKADQAPDCQQFLIFSDSLSSYQLFHYDEVDGEDGLPEVIASGATHVSEINFINLFRACLLDGVLFIYSQKEVELRTHSGDYYVDHWHVESVDVSAFDCTEAITYPISSLLLPKHEASSVTKRKPHNSLELNTKAPKAIEFFGSILTNEYSRKFVMRGDFWNVLGFANRNTMLMVMPMAYISIHFANHPFEAIKGDLEFQKNVLKEKQEEEKGKLLKAKKLGKKAKERVEARKEFVDKKVTMTGLVKFWKITYGFIKVESPVKAKALGNVFCHRSNFPKEECQTRRNSPMGRKVKFQVKSCDEGEGRIKAVDISFVQT